MNIISPINCLNKKNLTITKNLYVSNNIQTDYILPLNTGDTITVEGYRPTGDPDFIEVNFQFNTTTFAVDQELYIYNATAGATVISVKEAHTTVGGAGSSLALVKRSGVTDSTVVAAIGLETAVNTPQDGTIIGANSVLAAGDSLRIDQTGTIGTVSGAVVSIVLQLT